MFTLGIQPAQAAPFLVVQQNVASMEISPDGIESEHLLRATCIAAGHIDLRLYPFDVGKGEREPASLLLRNATLSTRVDGISVRSPNFNMTGATELLTSVETDGRAMRILTGGKPIEMKSTAGAKTEAETVTLDAQATGKLLAFVKRCS